MKFMIVYGTRPELIKLASFIYELKDRKIKHVLVNTGQHKEMVDKISKELKITPHYKLKIMKQKQSLNYIISNILNKLNSIIKKEKPTHLISFADTASAIAGALSAYNNKIPIIHFEGGVRSGNKYAPYPEEGYRTMIDHIADFNTCQTKSNAKILKKENVKSKILVSGNNSLDLIEYLYSSIKYKKNYNEVLITMHRREDWGKPIEKICKSIKRLTKKYPQVTFNVVLHPNPKVRNSITKILNNKSNIKLLKNMEFWKFMRFLYRATLVMTDSGGLLQEAIFLRKPILYLRKDTEFPFVFDNKFIIETGKDSIKVEKHASRIIEMKNPKCRIIKDFGDGTAGHKIIEWLLEMIK